jgi:hypothetical protein
MFWDGLLAPLLSLPAWLVLGVTAAIIAVLARKRRRTNIYANA